MRACLGCGRPTQKSRCPRCERERQAERKAKGLTGERGSTHASRQRRENVLSRANHVCFYCSAPGANIADHYVPRAKGGPDTEENMVAACQPCNSQKSDRMPDDFLHSNWLARRCEEVAAQRRDAA
ncbi:MAG TPA: HNH endonuclease [Solirubrobacterales bacterium]|nr:HNH endonuclease [Solirubrobacterales bacterium]